MTTREQLAVAAQEFSALQATIAAQPQTPNPVTGQEASSGGLVWSALIYGMRGTRAYLEDPLPFWVAGGCLLGIGVLIVFFAVRGARGARG